MLACIAAAADGIGLATPRPRMAAEILGELKNARIRRTWREVRPYFSLAAFGRRQEAASAIWARRRRTPTVRMVA
jgi:hypothetical protein